MFESMKFEIGETKHRKMGFKFRKEGSIIHYTLGCSHNLHSFCYVCIVWYILHVFYIYLNTYCDYHTRTPNDW